LIPRFVYPEAVTPGWPPSCNRPRFYLAIVLVFVAWVLVFVFQNTERSDVSFLALGALLHPAGSFSSTA
jgi:hypothetical protein